MGWFSSNKKEDNLPDIPSLQQVNPNLLQLLVQDSNSSLQNNSVDIPTTSRQANSNDLVNKGEPFFVRIDKFNEAKRNLVEIEKKMRDMESVLVHIGETK